MRSGDQWQTFTVTAVAKDFPKNSSFNFDILSRFEHFRAYKELTSSWDNDNHEVFVQLRDKATQPAFEKQTVSFIHKHYADKISSMKRDGSLPDKGGEILRLRTIPFTDVHFSEASFTGDGASKLYAYLLLVISAFIAFSSRCVSFVNLSLARSFTRSGNRHP